MLATFLLTIWQTRWSYFCVLVFIIALPILLAPIASRIAVWTAFALSILPILQFWDARLWPNESQLAAHVERRKESIELRELAMTIRSRETHAFLASWWLSPSISYWSGQPGVAGSSHEALNGISDSAQFFLTDDYSKAREILLYRRVDWVIVYNWDRVGQNAANLLGLGIPDRPIGRILDRSPTRAPTYLVLSGQNGAAKLFRFVDKL